MLIGFWLGCLLDEQREEGDLPRAALAAKLGCRPVAVRRAPARMAFRSRATSTRIARAGTQKCAVNSAGIIGAGAETKTPGRAPGSYEP
jgi:hypothetical protein